MRPRSVRRRQSAGAKKSATLSAKPRSSGLPPRPRLHARAQAQVPPATRLPLTELVRAKPVQAVLARARMLRAGMASAGTDQATAQELSTEAPGVHRAAADAAEPSASLLQTLQTAQAERQRPARWGPAVAVAAAAAAAGAWLAAVLAVAAPAHNLVTAAAGRAGVRRRC
eukprot:364280-Chlamydomonas_euryale.AAC.23